MEEITTTGNSNLYLNLEAQSFLKETAKWAYFLAILGFVGIVFLALLGVFMGTIFSNLGAFNRGASPMPMMGTTLITCLYLILAGVYFFPVYYLYQFASRIKLALRDSDNEKLTNSFEYLKSHYKFMGIMALVMVSLYGVVFIIGSMTFLFTKF